MNSGATVREVAETFGVSSAEIIKKLMQQGEMATLTQTLTDETIVVLADEFDQKVEIEVAMSRFGIELGMPLREDHPFITNRESFDKNGGFLSLIVVRVSDFDAAVNHLRERGIEPKGFLEIGGAREAIYDPADTFGLPIVLNEYTDSHGMTAQALGDPTLSSRS